MKVVQKVGLLFALLLPLLVESFSVTTAANPADCSELYANGHTLSGVYTIYPAGRNSPVQVYCDMGCEGPRGNGGKAGKEKKWTVIQRRMDGTLNFYRPWDQYKKGFGNSDGEFWLGLENIHQLTQGKKFELRVDMEDFDGKTAHAQYSSFSVGSERDGYRLHVSGYIKAKAGDAGDSLTYHNGQKFSTLDRDQDEQKRQHCARRYLGAFWYKHCHTANPNGAYLWGKHTNHHASGITWYHWRGHNYSLKKISMKIRPVA